MEEQKQIWLVEWTREYSPNNAPAPQMEETISVDTLASDETWVLFEAEYGVVDAMVDRAGSGWNIYPAVDGEYIDAGGDTVIIEDGKTKEAEK